MEHLNVNQLFIVSPFEFFVLENATFHKGLIACYCLLGSVVELVIKLTR